jgi:hypothetical protein
VRSPVSDIVRRKGGTVGSRHLSKRLTLRPISICSRSRRKRRGALCRFCGYGVGCRIVAALADVRNLGQTAWQRCMA